MDLLLSEEIDLIKTSLLLVERFGGEHLFTVIFITTTNHLKASYDIQLRIRI